MQSLYGAIANTNKKEIMAVSIDRVYQKVLALTNKEQRGYITPQEFNLFADLAQMEIFEQYFYDSNQFKRRPGNNSEYHDMVELIDEKLRAFRHVATVENGSWDDEFYKIGSVFRLHLDTDSYTQSVVVEQLKLEDFIESEQSPLTKSSYDRPVYYHTGSGFRCGPVTAPAGTEYRIDYIRKPIKPNWGYMVVNDKPLYNSSTSTDFELHLSDESELVYRILAFVGVAIEKPQLTQTAMGLEGAKVQQEKQ